MENMDSLFITEASRDDLPALADLLTELFTLESDFVPDRARQIAGLGLILDNPALGCLFVLRDEAEVVGMANALITVSTAEGGRVLLLEDVIVRQSHRGGGAGRHGNSAFEPGSGSTIMSYHGACGSDSRFSDVCIRTIRLTE